MTHPCSAAALSRFKNALEASLLAEAKGLTKDFFQGCYLTDWAVTSAMTEEFAGAVMFAISQLTCCCYQAISRQSSR